MKKIRSQMSAFVFTSIVLISIGQLMSHSAEADVVINYSVSIQENGPVTAGSLIHWSVFANIETTDSTNFGIATAAINLQDSFGEVLEPGNVKTASGDDFAGYSFPNGGAFNSGTRVLENIGATQFTQSETTVGADPDNSGSLGPFLLATGSYTVNAIGSHTLSTVSSASNSRVFTAADQTLGGSSLYTDVTFGSDTIQVNAVPEPGSLAVLNVALLGLICRRRRTR